MVAVVDELEELGYAERQPHPADRRKHAIHLTADGTRMLERAQTVAVKTTKEILAPLTADEVDELRVLLRKLAGAAD